MSDSRLLFLNLPVGDLKRSMEFFGRLGFEFDPKWTDEKAACMVISDKAWVMLLTEPFFATFTQKKLTDRSNEVGGMCALSCESRAEVDALMDKALLAGAGEARDEAQDLGFMYGRSFFDLDGHQWELLWMGSRQAAPCMVARRARARRRPDCGDEPLPRRRELLPDVRPAADARRGELAPRQHVHQTPDRAVVLPTGLGWRLCSAGRKRSAGL